MPDGRPHHFIADEQKHGLEHVPKTAARHISPFLIRRAKGMKIKSISTATTSSSTMNLVRCSFNPNASKGCGMDMCV